MVRPTIKMLASMISHMPLHFVWRDSGVTQAHGFDLTVHVSNVGIKGQPFIPMEGRAPKLLDGTYDFLSGLHHVPFYARAQGDKRFVYLAQAQNEWDDRVIVTQEIESPKHLEGKKFIITDWDSCVHGNLVHSLRLAGVDPERVEFIDGAISNERASGEAVAAIGRGEASAAIVDLPFDRQGEKLGMRLLKLPNVPVIHNITICANAEWVHENQETTLAFLRSMIDAIYFFKNERSRVCEILERNYAPIVGLKNSDEIEHLQETWATLLSPKPFPHPLAIWNVYNLDIAHDPKVNFVGPFEVWDTSYLRAIDDSGYVDKLYGGPQAAVNPPINPVI